MEGKKIPKNLLEHSQLRLKEQAFPFCFLKKKKNNEGNEYRKKESRGKIQKWEVMNNEQKLINVNIIFDN